MKRARRAGTVVVTSLATTGLALAAALPAQAAAPPGWRVVFSHQYGGAAKYNNLSVAVATSLNNAWAFGTDVSQPGAPGRTPLAEHWNGKKWAQSTLPSGTTDGIIAASAPAANDVWAVTFEGERVLHFNGSKWAVAKSWKPLSPYLSGDLTGVTALSPTNVWVFGGSGYGPGLGTWHLSGKTWSQVTTGPGSGVFSASAVSARDIWGIGSNGAPENAIVHYNGTAWSYITAPVLTGANPRAILATSKNSIWVTSLGATSSVLHYNGSKWSTITVPWGMMPWSITPDGSGGFWCTGTTTANASWVAHRTSKGVWSRIRIGTQPATGMSAVAAIPGTTSVWGVGNTAAKTGSSAAIWAFGKI